MIRKPVVFSLVLFVLAGLATALAPTAEAQEQLYTACNMWYEEPLRMWSTGYQKGALLPAGTPVSNVEIKKKWTKKYIMFVVDKTGTQHGVLWIPSHRPGVEISEMQDRLFSTKTFDQLTAGMTGAEKEAIKKGQVVKGMSKEAVLVAYGTPPETGTATRDQDQWKYWYDRFRTKIVNFENGKVTSITE